MMIDPSARSGSSTRTRQGSVSASVSRFFSCEKFCNRFDDLFGHRPASCRIQMSVDAQIQMLILCRTRDKGGPQIQHPNPRTFEDIPSPIQEPGRTPASIGHDVTILFLNLFSPFIFDLKPRGHENGEKDGSVFLHVLPQRLYKSAQNIEPAFLLILFLSVDGISRQITKTRFPIATPSSAHDAVYLQKYLALPQKLALERTREKRLGSDIREFQRARRISSK